MASFGPVAPYYDELMFSVPYPMWADYYQLLLAQIDARPRLLLDVCCGTGAVAELLARDGFKVVGFDISRPMIEAARSKNSEVEYHVADAAEVSLGRTFDAAYSFFDSLNYITDPERLEMAIKRVADHLEAGGSFVFDVNTAYAFERRMFDQRDQRRASRLKYKWVGDYDPASRIIKVTMDFWVEGRHFSEIHVQRAYSDEELRGFLEDAGFRVNRVLESYTLDPPRKSSDRLHYVAIKEPG
jgi:SAM-dependent methyltransferase